MTWFAALETDAAAEDRLAAMTLVVVDQGQAILEDCKAHAAYANDNYSSGLSIRAGRITPSTILRKLGNYSRKNRLYQVFRELGRVIRTVFLLHYISATELRRIIQAATNKSEACNRFVQWLLFGANGLIAENDRDRQRRLIKYNHLVANSLIFHNVYARTRSSTSSSRRGTPSTTRRSQRLSPYITEHGNRFGTYTLDFERGVVAPDYALSPLPECAGVQ